MGLKSRLQSWLLKEAQPLSINGSTTWHPYSWMGEHTTLNYTPKYSELKYKEAYAKNPFAFMVVEKIGKSCAGLPFYIKNQKDIEVSTGVLFDLFNNPNSKDSRTEFLKKAFCELNVCGDLFIEKEIPVGFSKIQSLCVLKSEYVDLIVNERFELIKYTYTYGGIIRDIPIESIIHIKFTNSLFNDSRALRGFSPFEALEDTVKTSSFIISTEKYVYENGGINSIVSSGSDLAQLPAERKAIEKQFNEDTKGLKKIGRHYVTGLNLKVQNIGVPPKSMGLDDASTAKLDVICGLFNLSPLLFGSLKSSTFNNLEEAKLEAYTECFMILTDFFLQKLNQDLQKELKTTDSISYDITKIKVLNKYNDKLSTTLVNEVNAGIMSKQQAFEILHPNLVFQQQPIQQ